VNKNNIIQLVLDEKEVPVNKKNIMQQAIDEKVWGIASSFDIYQCNPETIRDADKIKQFVVELCDLIEMKRFQAEKTSGSPDFPWCS
jgi:S-adenosylmethionine/arginine decarboxylase-like enzyme